MSCTCITALVLPVCRPTISSTIMISNENGVYAIVGGGANDPLAVFDGASIIPSRMDDKPTLLYSSVSHLPIHWTLPYTRRSEPHSLAVTYDGGHNFTKLGRPLLFRSL